MNLVRNIPAVAALLLAGSAMAHHSVAAYDRNNPSEVQGTVKEWHWANPHCWLELNVPDGKGGVQIWNFEGISATGFVRQGYKADTLKPGEKLKMLFAPRRDGNMGGEFLKVLTIDGQPFTASTGS